MNKVIFLGRLTAEPELRYTTGSNILMSTFTIAVDRPFQKQGEERQADFFRIVAWRSTAEFVQKYFSKGQQVLIEGYLRNNSYTDKDGNKRYSDDIHADKVYFADSKRSNDNSNDNKTYSEPAPYQLSEDEDLPF